MTTCTIRYKESRPVIFPNNWHLRFFSNTRPSENVLLDGVSVNNITDNSRVINTQESIKQVFSYMTQVSEIARPTNKRVSPSTAYEDMFIPTRVIPRVLAIDELISVNRLEYALHQYQESCTIDQTLDFLFETIEGYIISKEYDLCNKFLEYVSVEDHDIHILIGLLTVSLPWRKTLFYRSCLYDKVKKVVYDQYSIEEAEQILVGLE